MNGLQPSVRQPAFWTNVDRACDVVAVGSGAADDVFDGPLHPVANKATTTATRVSEKLRFEPMNAPWPALFEQQFSPMSRIRGVLW
jgi:hypothetical protein